MQHYLYFFISFLASIGGAICGIGGGVIIKPTLDLFQQVSVSTISFLSSCTVLSMSCFSVLEGLLTHDNQLEIKTSTPLALGAAVGGVMGQNLFSNIKDFFENENTIGAVQAACLFLVTLGTLIYTLNKSKIHTVHVKNEAICILIGLTLGVMSSFLGIGGGPINLIVLGFFFSMKTKTAAQNSLYIILLSQITNLLTVVLTARIPEFELLTLILMITGGISGGIIGRMLNKRMDNRAVDRLFILMMVLIMGISVHNTYRYALRS